MTGKIVAALLLELLLIASTTLFLAQPPWAFGEDRRLKPPQLRSIGIFLLVVTVIWSIVFGFTLAR